MKFIALMIGLLITSIPSSNMLELDRKNLKIGQKVNIPNLDFKEDSSRFTAESYAVLDELYSFLKSNKDISIEVRGHTNSIPSAEYCIKLSTERAQAVADYLINKSISESRLSFKGYGKRQPIAANTTPEGRKKNQRVEIKIVKFGK